MGVVNESAATDIKEPWQRARCVDTRYYTKNGAQRVRFTAGCAATTTLAVAERETCQWEMQQDGEGGGSGGGPFFDNDAFVPFPRTFARCLHTSRSNFGRT